MSEDFITDMEYASMLYQNPRGVGCHKCHGLQGEGKLIASYKHRGKDKQLIAPNITDINKTDFMRIFKRNRFKTMPKYFLTKRELNILYDYLKGFKKDD